MDSENSGLNVKETVIKCLVLLSLLCSNAWHLSYVLQMGNKIEYFGPLKGVLGAVVGIECFIIAMSLFWLVLVACDEKYLKIMRVNSWSHIFLPLCLFILNIAAACLAHISMLETYDDIKNIKDKQ